MQDTGRIGALVQYQMVEYLRKHLYYEAGCDTL